MAGLPRAVSDLLHRLIREDDAQDLIEYALLGAGIGLGSVAAINLLMPLIGRSYCSSVNCVNTLSAAPAPGATTTVSCTPCP
jgi:hypothetical protein